MSNHEYSNYLGLVVTNKQTGKSQIVFRGTYPASVHDLYYDVNCTRLLHVNFICEICRTAAHRESVYNIHIVHEAGLNVRS